MNILIYGGYGVLGRAIRKYLKREHNIFIVDEYGDVEGEDPEFRGMSMNDIEQLFYTLNNKPNIVIDLTETCTIDMLDSSSNIMSNVSNCARLMEMCRIQSDTKFHPVTMFYGAWLEPPTHGTSVFSYCCQARKDLDKYYNKCNTVITRLDIPRVISGEYASTSFSSVVCRIMDCIENGQQARTIMFDPQEFAAFNSVHWTIANSAAHCMFNNIKRRTRNPIIVDGISAPIQHIIGTMLDILCVEHIEIQTHRQGIYTFDRKDMNEEIQDGPKLRKWIGRAIREYVNNNTETSPD